MLHFEIDAGICTGCGLCAEDCRAQIIAMANGMPSIAPADEARCVRCQHCLAICPSGAVSIFGVKPEDCQPVEGTWPEPERLEALIEGRRTVRRYRRQNVEAGLIARLLRVAWASPTGGNARSVHFTLIDDLAVMDRFRQRVIEALRARIDRDPLPRAFAHFQAFVGAWDKDGVDIAFRGAPHVVFAHGPADAPTPVEDGLIALSAFDLLAQAHGLGTVWGGSATTLITAVVPEVKRDLAIPDDHRLAYTMMFGYPVQSFARSVQRGEPPISRPK